MFDRIGGKNMAIVSESGWMDIDSWDKECLCCPECGYKFFHVFRQGKVIRLHCPCGWEKIIVQQEG